MSLVALVGGLLRPGGGRHWPLGFVALAAFVYLRAAANEGTWPFGAVPLWTIDAEGIQHRIAALLVLALGALEWRARARPDRRSLLPYVFPALGAAGAVLLLTHSHAAFQSKQSFLVQVTHTTMGALAALLVAGRWLELRLAPPAARLAGRGGDRGHAHDRPGPGLLPGSQPRDPSRLSGRPITPTGRGRSVVFNRASRPGVPSATRVRRPS